MKPTSAELSLGARYLGGHRCRFRVWAPAAREVEVLLESPGSQVIPMQTLGDGYFQAQVDDIEPDTRYRYRLDGRLERPDPASRSQPEGVHRASAVVDAQYDWTDRHWFGLPLRDYVLYELHVGTFTSEGTFAAIIPHLAELRELGVTALELMPVAQFPGGRNWGYDGVHPFAVQNSYGGPRELRQLVNAAHEHGLAVVLDVVYNHLGPEGNYLGDFGPYFTDRYRTPWGRALNFDGPDSDEVRRFFIENALYWQTEFHIDALRLDAVHAIRDFSAVPFLEELAVAVQQQAERSNRRFHLIAESDMNMARHILPRHLGGYGLDAQWSDDFHHTLHVLLTGEQKGYYADFHGVRQFAKVWREGYAYTGEHARYRRQRHGSDPRNNGARQFVVCIQNHDQVGNRLLGDRLSASLSFESQKLAAGAMLLSPFIPLLFMGEEYGETAPFQYFVSHTDPALVEAVRKGRAEEFASFEWQGEVPDPQAEETFGQCKLNRALRDRPRHRALYRLHRELLSLRRALPPLAQAEKGAYEAIGFEPEQVLLARFWHGRAEIALAFAFAETQTRVELPIPPGQWTTRLDSASPEWEGAGSAVPPAVISSGKVKLDLMPRSFLVLIKEEVRTVS